MAWTLNKCENLMDLNDDCLLYVLRSFNLFELMNLLGISSRLDGLIFQDRTRFAHFDFEDLSNSKLFEIIEFLGPVAKSFEIEDNQNADYSVIFERIWHYCVNVEGLCLYYGNFKDVKIIQSFTLLLKRLKSLTLMDVDFDDSLGDYFKDAKLEELTIIDNQKITKNFFKHISNLKSLNISFCSKFTSECYIEILKKNLNLKRLKIHNDDDWLKDTHNLANFIASNLVELEIISFDILSSSVSLLGSLTNLRKLEIYQYSERRFDQCSISQEIYKLLENLTKNNKIEELYIIGNEIKINTDLVAKLTKLKKLKLWVTQYLKNAEITKLQSLINLESLEIRNVEKNSSLNSTILTLVKVLTKLKELIIRDIPINDDFTKQLIQALNETENRPKLEIFHGEVSVGNPVKKYEKLELNENLNLFELEF